MAIRQQPKPECHPWFTIMKNIPYRRLWPALLATFLLTNPAAALERAPSPAQPVPARSTNTVLLPGRTQPEQTAAPSPGGPGDWLQSARGRLAELAAHQGGGASRPAGATPAAAFAEGVHQLRQRVGGAVDVRFRGPTGPALRIKGPALERPEADPAPGGDREREVRTARRFLRNNRVLLGSVDPDQEWVLERQERDSLGRQQLRFAQHYRGLPMWPCELTVHLDLAGNVELLNGAFVATPEGVPAEPQVTAAEAMRRGRALWPEGTGAEATAPVLIVYGPVGGLARLAWKYELVLGVTFARRCVIDAINGAILVASDLCQEAAVTGSGTDALGQTRTLHVWAQGSTSYLVDTSKPMFDPASTPPLSGNGVIQVFDAQHALVDDPQFTAGLARSTSANGGWLPDAVGAAFGLSETYDYYRQRHGRNSLNNAGGNINSIVRVGVNLANAFWNPAAKVMLFGDGFTKGLDVCGHELTHGVINSIGSGGILDYHDQPGALNEALADIFGELVEARTLGRPDWLKGAQLGLRDSSGNPIVIQNYADPHQAREWAPGRRLPKRMSEFVPPTDPALDRLRDRDNNGVHINSAIINHAFYLLAEGMNGAVGRAEAERIFYRAMTVHLQKQSQFIDLRYACVDAAEELFGTNSVQLVRTAEAFDAVEIFDAPTSPDPSPVPTVAGPDATLALRYDALAGGYFLVRAETTRGDAAAGTALNTLKYLAPRRVFVTGDGRRAAFVTADHDWGMINTDGTAASLAGRPGRVHSLALAPNGRRLAFVPLDADRRPRNEIVVVDLDRQKEQTIRLYAPGTEGSRLDVVRNADTLDFTPDGGTLYYDAYAEIPAEGGVSLAGWTFYRLDLSTTNIQSLISPNANFDFGNPSLGHARPHLVTFEAVNKWTGVSTVYAGDMNSGELAAVGVIDGMGGLGFPCYFGDDTAIGYAQFDPFVPSGFSIVRQRVGADGFTPVDAPTWWLRDADLPSIYRRGTYVASNALPSVILVGPARGQSFAPGSNITLTAAATDADGSVERVEFYAGSTRLGEATNAPLALTWANVPAGRYRLTARAIDNLGGAADSDPVEVVVATGPRLGWPAGRPGSPLELTFTGDGGVVYEVQTSTNLTTWTPVVTVTNGSPDRVVRIPLEAGGERHRYFRALVR